MTCDYPPTLKTLPNRIYLQRTGVFYFFLSQKYLPLGYIPPLHYSTKIVITNHQLPTPTYLVSSNPTIALRPHSGTECNLGKGVV